MVRVDALRMLRHAAAAAPTAPPTAGETARGDSSPFAARRATFVAELAKLDLDALEARALDEQPIVLRPWREIFAEEMAAGMSVEDARFEMDCY